MIAIATLVFMAVLIVIAYKIGDQNAGAGVAVFIIGTLAFVYIVSGPEALFRGEDDCERYSAFASNC